MEPIALDRLTDLDAVLTEDEILARHTVRQFVADKYLPIIGDHFEHHTFPEALIPEIGALGVLGASIKGYGLAPWGSWGPVSRAMAAPASTPLPMA
jgi:glutaryl-CoA dehydrogenase